MDQTNPPEDRTEKMQQGLEKADQALKRVLGDNGSDRDPETQAADSPEGAKMGDPADILDAHADDTLTAADFTTDPEPLYGDQSGVYDGVDPRKQETEPELETEGGTSGGSSGGASAGLQSALSDGNSGGLTGDDDSDARVHTLRQDRSNPRGDDATRLGN